MAMNMKVVTAFTLWLVLLQISYTTCETVFTFKNNCPDTIWPGVLTASGSAQFPTTGFELSAGASIDFTAPPSWSGRFWPRTLCQNSGSFQCSTGDCGSGDQASCQPGAGGAPPVTLAEFTLNGDGGKDFFDISLVDGYNAPVSITPSGGGCTATSCPADVNSVCPPELKVEVDGRTVACKSACLAFGSPEYCCSGEFGTPDKCQPSNYSKIFKDQCPQAYSYAYDDATSTFTCPTGGNYVITFCP